ncbi:helix-turn-helix domain-containing protein [Anaerosacchariphilus polymeriproducens]|uniref:XRE family transcriptional regulator n=1 Tax=Anaerosacchariphilus polymeriproducens TaxID=1812858 RepID=A0A371AYU1_9FIRM|nr:helix-turn-helix transcriptional regulator [Anaerosacchariphilus polymeriproducens]RDU24765.1 XRE family transcriptional regulator [Anaerosacchariphilus polymeriproducens]
MKEFRDRLIELRGIHGITKAELAEKMNWSKSKVTRYENGEVMPNSEAMIELATKFNVSLDWLAGLEVCEYNKYDAIIRECNKLGITPEKLQKLIEIVKE